MHRLKILILAPLSLVLLLLAGCTTPKHTDLLVFGTNTQFGVSAATDSTANPGVLVGFKRQEVVLMPLYVNANDSRILPKGSDAANCDPVVVDKAKYEGREGGRSDTYSVLATFGARGEGEAGKAGVAIAQFFATGLAARTLAYHGGALVNTSTEAAKSAEEVSAAVAAENVGYQKRQMATLDAIMAKLQDPGGLNGSNISKAELDKAFSGVDQPPSDALKNAWTADHAALRAALNDQFQFDLERIDNNLK